MEKLTTKTELIKEIKEAIKEGLHNSEIFDVHNAIFGLALSDEDVDWTN